MKELIATLNRKRNEILDYAKTKLRKNELVYTGEMKNGEWVADSLHKLYTDSFEIREFPKRVDNEDNLILPKGHNQHGWQFIGGNDKRVVYMNPDFLEDEKHEKLATWWREKGDTHLLSSMMTRPGKLAVMEGRIKLPPRNQDSVNDGLLFTLAPDDWKMLLEVWDLPRSSKLAQVTIFSPEGGAIGKGTIRETLPDEEPALYEEESWKFIHEEFTHLESHHMSVLTTDAVYRPSPGTNMQEFTYITKNGGEFASWVMDDIDTHIQDILAGEYSSPMTAWGYLQTMGLPAPDDMLDEVVVGAKGALHEALRKWNFGPNRGWRGKVSAASSGLEEGEILLPLSAKKRVKAGDEVWVNRNPNLPEQGYVPYTVKGFVEGNFSVLFGGMSSVWNAWLGGDFDGDDMVVFYENPFSVVAPIRDDIDLQNMKFEQRQTGTDVDACLQRYESEMMGNIGQWDILGRYAVDMGAHNDELMYEITKLIQLTISLKKRVGTIEVPGSVQQLRTAMKDVKEFTQTYFIRNYADFGDDEREWHRAGVTLHPQVARIVEWVEDAVDNLPNVGVARYSMDSLRKLYQDVDIPAEVKALVETDVQEYGTLIKERFEAYKNGEESLHTEKNREMKRFFQVELAERNKEMDADTRRLYTIEAAKRLPWTGLLYSMDTEFLVEYIERLFKKEKAMLVGEHNLKEGDTLTIPPFTREVDGLKLSRGILCISDSQDVKVVKTHRKSVVVEFINN